MISFESNGVFWQRDRYAEAVCIETAKLQF